MTIDEAINTMIAVFRECWEPTGFLVKFPDSNFTAPTDQPYAVVSYQFSNNGKVSLSDHIGRRIYARSGTFYIQIFTPTNDAVKNGCELSQNVINTFENAHNDNLRFDNIYPVRVGQDGNFYQTNVLVNFYFEDIH